MWGLVGGERDRNGCLCSGEGVCAKEERIVYKS